MSALELIPATELEAVNEMLSAIGESPVVSLDTDSFADAQLALSLLRIISRRVQKLGCHFNTEKSFRISPNTDGEIIIPSNALSCDEIIPQGNWNRDLVVRGRRLYDVDNHTYNIGEPVEVDLVLFLDFEEAPENFRDYVTIRASRVFVDRTLGEAADHKYTKEDEIEAKAAFTKSEIKSRDANFLNNIHSKRILNRRHVIGR